MKKFLIISFVLVLTGVFVCGAFSYAALESGTKNTFDAGSGSSGESQFIPCGGATQPDCTLCHFVLMIKNIMDFLVNTSFIVVSLMVGIGGIMYMLSSGEIAIAKKTITSALWGFIIVMSAWLIINSMLVAMGYNEANIGLKSAGNQFILNCEVKK